MAIKSKEEIDFKRLLKKCELSVDQNINSLNQNNWRLEKVLNKLFFVELSIIIVNLSDS